MATKYATLKDSNGDTIYPQISTDSIASSSITGAKMDWSTMYIGVESSTSKTVTNTDTIVQSITLPAGKWKVFLQFRLTVTGMSSNSVQTTWVGFKNGDTSSSSTILEEGLNNYSDASGVVRNLYSLSSPVIDVPTSKVVSSYVRVSNAYSGASVSNAGGIYLWAIRVG